MSDIDLHVGKRLRRRRRLLGLTQQQVGSAVGLRFQQIQKYECGANRLTAGRLYEIALALHVPASYFFEGLTGATASLSQGLSENGVIANDVFGQEETIELVRAYYTLGQRPRRRLLDLAKALQEAGVDAA